MITSEMCLDAIEQSIGNDCAYPILNHIPKKFYTYEMSLRLAIDGNMYRNIHIDRAMCNAIVATSIKINKILEHIPTTMWSDTKFCLHAVTTNGMSLKYVPPELRTEEMYLRAMESNPRCFDEIPERLWTKDFAHDALS